MPRAELRASSIELALRPPRPVLLGLASRVAPIEGWRLASLAAALVIVMSTSVRAAPSIPSWALSAALRREHLLELRLVDGLEEGVLGRDLPLVDGVQERVVERDHPVVDIFSHARQPL